MAHKHPTNLYDCLKSIVATTGGIALCIVTMFVIFANDPPQLIICAYIIIALATLALIAARHEPHPPADNPPTTRST